MSMITLFLIWFCEVCNETVKQNVSKFYFTSSFRNSIRIHEIFIYALSNLPCHMMNIALFYEKYKFMKLLNLVQLFTCF